MVKPGIRVKFIGILILATVLPLVIAASAVYVLGTQYYQTTSGRIFKSRAQQMANYLVLSVNGYTESLHDWLALSDFYHRLEAHNELNQTLPLEAHEARLSQIQEAWQEADPESDLVRGLVENDIAHDLREFLEISPLFAEIFVTDRSGQMIAATGKTTNFWHARQEWWQTGMTMPFRNAYVEGVNYDESAGVYSFDLIIPIRDRRNPDAPPAGVVKGVVDASPLFFELARLFTRDDAEWKVVIEDGSVLFAHGFRPLERRIQQTARDVFADGRTGWMLRRLDGPEPQMTGFARLPWPSNLGPDGENAHLYVLVHLPAAEVLAPVRAQLLMITGGGFLLILLFFLTGLYLAQYHIIHPIHLLQVAAQKIASSAKLSRSSDAHMEGITLEPSTRRLLDRIVEIKSQDEIGELARDFSSMANRVLSYHAHLEAEIDAKVAEIQGDLLIAREFQEALMPHEYPKVPEKNLPGALTLEFNHIYKPASTVGGDFFNVLKLSEDRAGIFIADVMGHGARSALVTAIVATLLHDLAPKSADPAEFMSVLNQHFHHLIQHSKQVIFVTAFYLVIDTRERRAFFSSAGHPSPLFVQRKKQRVRPLIHSMQNDTALGLLEDSTYACFSCAIAPEDMFLLFTDGLFEVLNPKGEEFGVKKLLDLVNQNIGFTAGELSQNILDTVNRYSGFAAQNDDICLVSVEVDDAP
jgi:phosphoserine phosphatase RsbU/P